MISCIAIDDEPLALDLISNYCSRIEFLDLRKTFTRTSEAADFMKKFPVDLLFLDIQMPDISGIDFYKSLGESKMVIFTTAYSEYGVEGFNLNAVDYLLKPITFPRFEQAVKKTREYFDYLHNRNPDINPYLFVRSDYKLVKIAFADILYIEGLDDYIRIFTGQKRPVTSRISMKSISERLPVNMFVRIHRSYIINYRKEISYSNKKIQFGDIQLPVGISFEKNVRKMFGME
jgi:DNA-binding LytR/AlgR family response regulator